MKRHLVFYAATLVVFLLLMALIVERGRSFEAVIQLPGSSAIDAGVGETSKTGNHSDRPLLDRLLLTLKEAAHHLAHPLSRLLLQILVVGMMARFLGRIFRRINQPSVVGEVAAGILLGPSFLGLIFPATQTFLFPAESLGSLQLFSQIGLIFFLFLIGMELDIEALRKKAHSAIVVSHASILLPFFLGMLISLGIYSGFAPPGVSFLPFSLFMGIALSITAFPVLARILQERDLASTRMGAMVLACAAADDVTAWSILAAVVAVGRAADPIQGVTAISLTLLFIVLMFRFARPVLSRLGRAYENRESLSPAALAGVFFFVFGSALTTEIIGVHALFGAFIAGTALPRNAKLREQISEKIRDLSLIVLLPLFFAFTGIRTRIGLLDEPVEWMIGAGIFAAAVLGKFGGGVVASRIVGESWKDSFSIGALMNARGLMELVVLNIGYDLGIISPEIFAMMVLMALGTTFMTGPALDLIERFSEKRINRTKRRGIVVAFARPETGVTLMRIASLLHGTSRITAVHFDPEAGLPGVESKGHGLAPQGIKIWRELESVEGARLLFRSAEDVAGGIVRQAQEEEAGFLLIGSARSVWSDDVLGGKVRYILNRVSCPVGVLSDRGLKEIQRVLIVRKSHDDDRLLKLWSSATEIPGMRCDLLTLEEGAKSEERRRNRREPFFAVSRSAITPAALEEYSLVVMDRLLWGDMSSVGMNVSCLVVSFPD